MGTKKQKPKEKERNRRTEKGKRGGSHRSQWGFPQNGTKMKRNKSKKWWREQGVKARFVFIIEIYKGGGGATTTTSSTSFFIMIGWTSWSLHPSWFVCRLVGLLWGRTDHAPPRKDTITRAQKEKKNGGGTKRIEQTKVSKRRFFFKKKKRRYLRTSSRRLWVGRWFVCLFLRVCVCVCVCVGALQDTEIDWREASSMNLIELFPLNQRAWPCLARQNKEATTERHKRLPPILWMQTTTKNGDEKREKKKKDSDTHVQKKKRRRHGRNSSFRIGWLIGWLCCSGRLVFGWLVGFFVFFFKNFATGGKWLVRHDTTTHNTRT